jgi:O-antigen/teichoic acid export membrane protein
MSTASDAERRETERRDQQIGARGAGTNFLTLAGQTGLLLFQMLGTRLFGAATWGAYAIGLSVVDVCTRLGLAGSDKGVMIFVAARRAKGDKAGEERAIATGIRLSLGMGVLLALGVIAASSWAAEWYGKPMLGPSLRYLAPTIPMVALATVLLAGTVAYRTLRYNFLARGVADPAVRITLVTVMGLMSSGIGPLAFVYVAAMVAMLVVATWGFGRVFSLARTAASMRDAPFDGAMVRYALPLAVAELVNSFLAQTNVLLVGKLRPIEDAGVYAACVVLANAVSQVRGAFDTVVAPVAAEAWAHGDKQRIAAHVKLMSRLVLLFAVPLAGLFIVGGEALLAMHGPDFVRGARTVSLLALGHVVNASLGLAGWVLLASGRSKTVLANNVGALIVNVGLCLVLIPRFGIEGAAASFTLAVLALHIAQSIEAWVLARAQPLSWGFARLAALGALVVSAELVLDRMLGGSALIRGVALAVGGAVVFFLVAWWLSPPDEHDVLRAMLRMKAKLSPSPPGRGTGPSTPG